MIVRHGSLFSGIGGFDYPAELLGWENVFQVENDEYCNKVLEKNFPNVKRYGDIKEFDGKEYRGAIDVVSGGVPCQPASIAGTRKGSSDDRWLWDEADRIVGEIKPPFVVFENVTGLLSLENGKAFDRILTSLEDKGYEVEAFIVPACGVGAWHRRDRVWIIAYSDCKRQSNRNKAERKISNIKEGLQNNGKINGLGGNGITNNSGSRRCKLPQDQVQTRRDGSFNPSWWEVKSGICGVANGIPGRVDRLERLGNTIVPQVALEFFKCIDMLMDQTKRNNL